MRKKSLRRRRQGFTLMEVLLVLAILVILGSLATFSIVNAQKSGYRRAAQTQVDQFAKMMDTYLIDVGNYPSTQEGLNALVQQPADIANPAAWGGPYTDNIPLDPWNNPYEYELLDGETFVVMSYGPDRQKGTQDDITSLPQQQMQR